MVTTVTPLPSRVQATEEALRAIFFYLDVSDATLIFFDEHGVERSSRIFQKIPLLETPMTEREEFLRAAIGKMDFSDLSHIEVENGEQVLIFKQLHAPVEGEPGWYVRSSIVLNLDWIPLKVPIEQTLADHLMRGRKLLFEYLGENSGVFWDERLITRVFQEKRSKRTVAA